jgi:aspartyl protease family protein
MRQIIVIAGLFLAVGTLFARYADKYLVVRPAPASSAMAASAVAPAAGSRTVVIRRDDHGHFAVNARIDGRRMDFMVDTGASMIALTQNAAGQLGLFPTAQEFSTEVKTANGIVHAARAQLDRVEIDDIEVRDVAALIMPDASLSENLLGLSFLSRLRRFEYSDGQLVLEQ